MTSSNLELGILSDMDLSLKTAKTLTKPRGVLFSKEAIIPSALCSPVVFSTYESG